MNVFEMIESGFLSEDDFEEGSLDKMKEGKKELDQMREQAMANLNSEGDIKEKVGNVMCLVEGHKAVRYVHENREYLQELGMLEHFLVDSFVRHNWSNFSVIAELKQLFAMCDREKLSVAGDDISDGEVFTVYRGIPDKNWSTGWSWTGSRKVAEWFANRYDQKGIVIEKDIKRDDILFYTNDREEDEYVIEI